MASVGTWIEVLSYVKALYDVITFGGDVLEQYRKHRQEKDTIAEANRVSVVFSTYSEEELQAILGRLKSCRDRFIEEGSGPARRRCLCQVFQDVIDGNGGSLPVIDDWQNIHGQLNCPRAV